MITMFKKIFPYLIKFILLIISFILWDDEWIGSVNADSDDDLNDNPPKRDKGKGKLYILDSDDDVNEHPPKRFKGKGKAREIIPDIVDLTQSDEEELLFKQFKEQQEISDFELAKRLQDEEYEASKPKVEEEDKSSSEYTVLSSEIHTDDDSETKAKKLAVKEFESRVKNPSHEESGESSVQKNK